MKSITWLFAVFTLSFFVSPTFSVSVEDNFEAVITKKLKNINSNFTIESIDAMKLPDFMAVQIKDGPLLYVHKSGRYMLAGTLFELTDSGVVNLSEQKVIETRKKLMSEVKNADVITFAPAAPKKIKAHIYVYTDVDCGYCRKLHQEIPALNEAGIALHYLAFPRAGIGSKSYQKIATAWCNKDRQGTMNKLKNGEPVAIQSCDNPVASQYELGKKMGVNGTPAILLEDGSLIPGYRPAAELIPIVLENSKNP